MIEVGCLATIKVKIYPDFENVVTVEVSTTVVKDVLELLKDTLNLRGQYALVKNDRILSSEENVSNGDEILLIPVVEGG
ncbi:MAG: MoaD/ThiS family protein [Desulfurococcaceae archaeon TW002]